LAIIDEKLFTNATNCCHALGRSLANELLAAVSARGRAVVAVSGGRTPRLVFPQLAAANLPWDKITIILTDERWVATDDPDSNERLVRDTLVKGPAAAARLIGLKTDDPSPAEGCARAAKRLRDLPMPLDVVYLGLGADGHIASLFVGSPGMAADDGLVVATSAPAVPRARLSLTLPVLANARAAYLHLIGAHKRRVYERAKAADSSTNLPIVALLTCRKTALRVYIAET